jgi:putative ABC transport system permease protein
MSWWTDVRERVRGLFLMDRADRELENELRFHLEMDIASRVRSGASESAARRAAERAFGGVDRYREQTRDARGVRPLADFVHDVRYALRALRRNPGFALAAVLALGLGMGANTSIFSAVNAVVLRPLPFPEPDQLYMLWEENPEKNWHQEYVAPANMMDWRERVKAFEDVAAYTTMGSAVLTGANEPQMLAQSLVTGNFFSVLRSRPLLGRTLHADETWQTAEATAVISHRLWVRSFGSDPGIVNRMITLDGEAVRVVGVMGPQFAFPSDEVDVWSPTRWPASDREQVSFRRAHWLRAIARLEPAVTRAQANAQLQSVVAQLKVEYPQTNRYMGAGMTPLQDFLIGDTKKPLLVLLGAVGLLLLIGCANVGNLLLVKAAGRQREIAVRSALGAGRFRLIRQMLTESLVLSLVGGVVGLLIGVLGTRFLIGLAPVGLLPDARFNVDMRVVGFVLLVSLASGLLFGSVPALWTHRAGSAAALKEGGRSGMLGRSARTVANGLVVAEVAIALLLVVGAGLLVRSFQQLLRVDPGFDAHGVLAVDMNLYDPKYEAGDSRRVFYESLLERTRALPGVSAVAATSDLPLEERGYTSDFVIFGRERDVGTEVIHRTITPDYLRTMRIPVRLGRSFRADDIDPLNRPVLINDVLARRFFPNGSPIGQRLAFDRVANEQTIWYTIVGVAGSERQVELSREPQIEVFHPTTLSWQASMTVLLRTTGEPLDLLPAVRRVAGELDPNLPVSNVRSLEAVRAAAVTRERFLMTLLLLFAAVALTLAIIGIHGVTAQFTRQRTQEIGVRLALGAEPVAVVRMMLLHSALLVGSGITLGFAAALAGTRALGALLYQIDPIDPLTFAAVGVLLGMCGLIATWLPARHASRLDPLSALRQE